jgi:hypothetical protein
MYRNYINSIFFDKMVLLASYYSLAAWLTAALLLAFILLTFLQLKYHCFEPEVQE